jgi:hypothetical protein
MSILLSILMLQASTTPPESVPPAATPASLRAATANTEPRFCREMLVSSSRLGAIKVCKTRAGWQRWEKCHSATRYCAPPTQQTVTVASLPGDKLICKYLKTTGSRIEQEKICATKRQWELTELETQETIRDRQNQTKWIRGEQ